MEKNMENEMESGLHRLLYIPKIRATCLGVPMEERIWGVGRLLRTMPICWDATAAFGPPFRRGEADLRERKTWFQRT